MMTSVAGEIEARQALSSRGRLTDLADVLFRQGVEPYVNSSDTCEPRRQQAFKTPPAPSPDLEGRIAECAPRGAAAGW